MHFESFLKCSFFFSSYSTDNPSCSALITPKSFLFILDVDLFIFLLSYNSSSTISFLLNIRQENCIVNKFINIEQAPILPFCLCTL